jgi:general secretion pathway protein J
MMRRDPARKASRSGARGRRDALAGFTLIEALVATALMGLILTALATITAQWLPNWNRGIARVQRADLINMSLNRLTADIQAAEFIPPSRGSKVPLFDGTDSSIILVRSAIGPAAGPGLEIVRIAETRDGDSEALVRSTMPFVPFDPTAPLAAQLKFAHPVVMLRLPYQVSFAYAGIDGQWKTGWQNETRLPAAVRLSVRDAATQQALSISTTALVHVELPACAAGKGKGDCLGQQPGGANRPGNTPPGNTPPPQPPSMRGELPVARGVL